MKIAREIFFFFLFSFFERLDGAVLGEKLQWLFGGIFKHGDSEGKDDYGVFGFLIDFLFLVDAELAGAHVYEEKKTSARGGLV